MLTRPDPAAGVASNAAAPSAAPQDGRADQSAPELRRGVRLKWRAGAWLPEPGWVLPLLDDGQAQGESWIVVSANQTDQRGWIEVELRRG